MLRAVEDDRDFSPPLARWGIDEVLLVLEEELLALLALDPSTPAPPCWLVMFPKALRLVVMPCLFGSATLPPLEEPN